MISMTNPDMTTSDRLGLPYIQPSQAQKHITVNEGFRMIDALSHLPVKSIGVNAPPSIPQTGDRYIVGSDPDGLWRGQVGALAIWDVDAWRFSTPREGWRAWDQSQKAFFVYDGTSWGEVGGSNSTSAPAASAAPEFILPLLPGFALHRDVFTYAFDVANLNVLTTTAIAPKNSLSLGITAKVIEPLDGIEKWRMGTTGKNRNWFYAYGLLPTVGFETLGMADTVMRCREDTPVLITRETGSFRTGKIEITQYTLRSSVV